MERTIKPQDFATIAETTLVLDVRRKEDRDASSETVAGAIWQDPTRIDHWIHTIPHQHEVVIYCVRGGSVSNSVVDRLQAAGIAARFIEGGIEGLKTAGGKVVAK